MIDPGPLAVLFNGLQQVCNEMDLAFVRSAEGRKAIDNAQPS